MKKITLFFVLFLSVLTGFSASPVLGGGSAVSVTINNSGTLQNLGTNIFSANTKLLTNALAASGWSGGGGGSALTPQVVTNANGNGGISVGITNNNLTVDASGITNGIMPASVLTNTITSLSVNAQAATNIATSVTAAATVGMVTTNSSKILNLSNPNSVYHGTNFVGTLFQDGLGDYMGNGEISDASGDYLSNRTVGDAAGDYMFNGAVGDAYGDYMSNGVMHAASYVGSGSSLTSLTAANISAGTAAINISGNSGTATATPPFLPTTSGTLQVALIPIGGGSFSTAQAQNPTVTSSSGQLNGNGSGLTNSTTALPANTNSLVSASQAATIAAGSSGGGVTNTHGTIYLNAATYAAAFYPSTYPATPGGFSIATSSDGKNFYNITTATNFLYSTANGTRDPELFWAGGASNLWAVVYSEANPNGSTLKLIHFLTSPNLTNWTDILDLNLGAATSDNYIDTPHFVSDATNGIHVNYCQDDGHYIREIHPNSQDPLNWGSSNNWSSPVTLTDASSAALVQGNTSIKWDAVTGLYVMGYNDVSNVGYKLRTSTNLMTGWSSGTTISFNGDTSANGGDSLNLNVLPSGTLLWYVCTGNNHTYQIYYGKSTNNGTSWTSLNLITFNGFPANYVNWSPISLLNNVPYPVAMTYPVTIYGTNFPASMTASATNSGVTTNLVWTNSFAGVTNSFYLAFTNGLLANATAPAALPGTNGLMHYYSFDTTGGTNDAALANTPLLIAAGSPVFTNSSGKIGNGFACTTNTYLTNSLDDLKTIGAWTVNVWVRARNADAGGNTGFALTYGDDVTMGWDIYANSAVFPYVQTTPGWQFYDNTGTLYTTNWIMYSVTYDGTTWRGYINGAPSQSAPTSTQANFASAVSHFTVGSGWTAGAAHYHFYGDIDELSTWNKTLTAAEISWQYNSGAGRSFANQTSMP